MTAPVGLPIPVVVTRHQCPHCRRTWAKKPAAQAHIARCWHNPDANGCKTCAHYEPPTEGPYPGHPGWPEECGVDGPMTDRPITGCPLWQGKAAS